MSGYEHVFKAFERMQHMRESTLILTSRIIPHVWRVPLSHGPQVPNQSNANNSKKDSIAAVTL